MTTIIVTHEDNEVDEFEFDNNMSVISIGRRSRNHVCIPNLSVSGEHAQIKLINDRLCIEDQNSTNGTYVNGRLISRQQLDDDDEIMIGKTRVNVKFKPVATTQEPAARQEPAASSATLESATETPTKAKGTIAPARMPGEIRHNTTTDSATGPTADFDASLDEDIRRTEIDAINLKEQIDNGFEEDDDEFTRFENRHRSAKLNGISTAELVDADDSIGQFGTDHSLSNASKATDLNETDESIDSKQSLSERARSALKPNKNGSLAATPPAPHTDILSNGQSPVTATPPKNTTAKALDQIFPNGSSDVGLSTPSVIQASQSPIDDIDKEAATVNHNLDNPVKRSGAIITIKNGAKSGTVLSIDKPVTTLGRPGIQIAAIMRKPDGYHLMHIESDESVDRPTLNRDTIGDEPVLLHSGDELNVAGIDVEFMLS